MLFQHWPETAPPVEQRFQAMEVFGLAKPIVVENGHSVKGTMKRRECILELLILLR